MPPALTTSPKQAKFVEAVLSGTYRLLAMGGGIRGTKTFAVLIVLLILCRIYPKSRWAIVRKDLPTLRRNTVPSIEKIRLMAGGFLGPLNQSTWTYTCANGSQIILFPESFTIDPELERWRGLEVNGFALEEANELNEASLNKARERAGAYIIPDDAGNPAVNQPKPIILCTFNPCSNWPKRIFYDPYMAGTISPPVFYLPATIADNPWAGDEYKEGLKDLPEDEYKKFVLGDWTVSDDPNQLIKFEWIIAARNVEIIEGPVRGYALDVARYGDDFSTECAVGGNTILGIAEHGKMETTGLSDLVAKRIQGLPVDNFLRGRLLQPIDADIVKIDSVGVGAGVFDNLRKAGYGVREIVAGARPVERVPKVERIDRSKLPLQTLQQLFKYKNLRSQIWWEFREKLRLGMFALPEGLPEKLVTDLTAVHYEISSDREIKLESKDDLKLRIGRSTDYGDAVVMADFELPPAPRRPVIVPTHSSYSFGM